MSNAPDIQHKPAFRQIPGLAFNDASELEPVAPFNYDEIERKLGWQTKIEALETPRERLLQSASDFRDVLLFITDGRTQHSIFERTLVAIWHCAPELCGEHTITQYGQQFGVPKQAMHRYLAQLKEKLRDKEKARCVNTGLAKKKTNNPTNTQPVNVRGWTDIVADALRELQQQDEIRKAVKRG